MIHEKLKEDLENQIKDLVQVFDILERVMNGEIKTLESPEQFSFMNILVSDAGITFQEHITNLLQFWIKVMIPRFSSHIILEQAKFAFAGLLGEDIYQKLSEILLQLSKSNIASTNDTKNQKNSKSNVRPIIGSEEYSTIGSMAILVFSGYIEDYLNQLKVSIFKELIAQGKAEEAISLIEKFSRSSVTNRVKELLEGMNLRNFVSEYLHKYAKTSYRSKFDEFRVLRNEISHTAAELNFADFNPEVEIFSNFIKKTIVFQTKSVKQITDTQRDIMKNMVGPLLPIVSYLFLLYCKILPYLTFLDHSFFLWSNLSVNASKI